MAVKKKSAFINFFSFKTIAILIVSIGLFGFGSFIIWASFLKIPDISVFSDRVVAQSTKIYDRTGKIVLFDGSSNIQRTLVPLSDISRHIKNATVAIEDEEFYLHKGIKPTSILRAVFKNIISRDAKQGGSTITQQVVKNSILTQKKLLSRKFKEWILALKLEQKLSKEKILEIYLNETPYGGNIYGVKEATEAFFGKNPAEVSPAEAAYIAALPQAPTYYSPYGNHNIELEKRKNLILKKMLELGFIKKNEFKNAMSEKVDFLPRSGSLIKAPHFVMYVKEYLENRYGKEIVERGGLEVITTLDAELQAKGEEIVKNHALKNKEKFNAENAGLIAIDQSTGQILVMVGSRNYFDKKIDGNFNVTLSHRQPGSAFKPFVYATAFEKGYTPETVVFDLETEFSTLCTPEGKKINNEDDDSVCYRPHNYDGVFRGPVKLRNALAQSINIPAIKTLYLAGMGDSLKTAQRLGIKSLDNIGRYGLTLVLGGGEVSLLDITSAYGVFANTGIRNPYVSILEVKNPNGDTLEKFKPNPTRVMDKQIALTITDILSDNDARAPAFGERSFLYFPGYDVAVKTGTTNDYRDAWIIGYTNKITVGAWAGNNDNSPMEKKVAGFIVAPMWNKFMYEAIKKFNPGKFERPKINAIKNSIKPILRGIWRGGITYKIDSISKKLATKYTPEELIKEKVVVDPHSILYWLAPNDPLGDTPEKPESDPQYIRWEIPVKKWVEQNNIATETPTVIPTETDDIHLPELSPEIEIVGIKNPALYKINERVRLGIFTKNKKRLSRVYIFMNNKMITSIDNSPFNTSFLLQGGAGKKTIQIIAYDNVLNKTSVLVPIEIYDNTDNTD